MNTRNSQSLSVITIPAKMKRQIEKVQNMKEIAEKQRGLIQKRQGDKTKPIITCKNPKLNHYRGQTYGKFDAMPLASHNWQGKKSKGDSFTIHNHAENPAFAGIDDFSPSFEELGLDPRLVEQLKNNGYNNPTNIQTLAIPRILEGLNTIVSAETGNGKTLAFLAPIIHQVLNTKEKLADLKPALNSPQAFIIVPSRELVAQTRDMARALCDGLDIRINSIFGGRTRRMMLYPRLWEHDIVVGSFGALSKLITNRIYHRTRVNHIVLDEADTLLDDSFNEKIKYFLSKFPLSSHVDGIAEEFTGVQLTFVGATFPRSLETILDGVIDIDSVTQVRTPYLHKISPHVTHNFLRVGSSTRLELLLKLTKKNLKQKIPTIIFSNTAACSNFVSHFLNDNEIPCINVNADMDAFDRIKRFEKFQDGEFYFMSGTDLVSRGLNTVRAKHIVNFEFPSFISDYIHRCGRTGRVGCEGVGIVTSFVYRPNSVQLVQKIEYAARKVTELPNVNANIKRSINARVERRNQSEFAAHKSAEEKEELEENLRRL